MDGWFGLRPPSDNGMVTFIDNDNGEDYDFFT